MRNQIFTALVLLSLISACSKSGDETSPGSQETQAMSAQKPTSPSAQSSVKLPAVFNAETYASALKATQQSAEKARQRNYQWVGAVSLQEQATELAADGHYKEAIVALAEAQSQNELAIAQAAHEAEDWRNHVVK